MLLFFGDPESRGVKEDALQCVRMAVAMQRRMADLQGLWQEKGTTGPSGCASASTRHLHVGNFGSAERMDYTIIGAEVNLASRLEHVADPRRGDDVVRDLRAGEGRVRGRGAPGDQGQGDRARDSLLRAEGHPQGGDATRRFVVKEAPGLRLSVNLDQINGDNRETALAHLAEVMEKIRGHR
jgi:hypothetical protein